MSSFYHPPPLSSAQKLKCAAVARHGQFRTGFEGWVGGPEDSGLHSDHVRPSSHQQTSMVVLSSGLFGPERHSNNRRSLKRRNIALTRIALGRRTQQASSRCETSSRWCRSLSMPHAARSYASHRAAVSSQDGRWGTEAATARGLAGGGVGPAGPPAPQRQISPPPGWPLSCATDAVRAGPCGSDAGRSVEASGSEGEKCADGASTSPWMFVHSAGGFSLTVRRWSEPCSSTSRHALWASVCRA